MTKHSTKLTLHQLTRKNLSTQQNTISQLVFFPVLQKNFKELLKTKIHVTLMTFYHHLLKSGKYPLTRKNVRELFSWAYQKRLTQYNSKCSLPNYIKKTSLKLLFSFITNHWEELKVDFYVSQGSQFYQVVPASARSPILFFPYLTKCNICNFADDTIPNICAISLNFVLEALEKQPNVAMTWFENNYMKMIQESATFLFRETN